MATLMVAMFILMSHHSTAPTNKKSALRNGQASYQKPSLREFDFDQVGIIQESSSQNDDGIDQKQNAKTDQQPPKQSLENNSNDDGNVDDDAAEDDYYMWDVDAFERDADMLDAQTTLNDAVDQFELAMAEQLLSLQPEIDNAVQTTMKQAEQDVKALNQKRDKNVQFPDDALKKLMVKVEDQLRHQLYDEIQSQSNDILEDLTWEMEAAIDINEQYEEEGEGEPIDLDMEEEELLSQGVDAVSDIVEDVLNHNIPEMLCKIIFGQLQESLKQVFGKDRKFIVDMNKKEWKITGWKENVPPKPKPEPEKKNEDNQTKDESKKEPEKKDEGGKGKDESKKDSEKKEGDDNKKNGESNKEPEKKEEEDKPKEEKSKEEDGKPTDEESTKEEPKQETKKDAKQKENKEDAKKAENKEDEDATEGK